MGVSLKPATKFLGNSLYDQWEHVQSEIQEIEQALEDYFETPSERIAHIIGEEATDAQISLETLKAILFPDEKDRNAIMRYVVEKNRRRGYYDDNAKVIGVGPDAPVVAKDKGGRQSKCDYLFTDFDPKALLRVASVSARGFEKYGPGNWRKISADEHINHALTHMFAHLAGDKQEDHLAHAVCRLLFAMGVEGDA